jgi:adenine phosphoribosyltransferase
MSTEIHTQIAKFINVIPDFPRKGIDFRDISPLLANYEMREKAIDLMYELVRNTQIDYVAGLESRGFLFGTGLAQRFKCGFVMIRKPNKLPNTISMEYDLEYGTDTLTIQKELMPFGSRVLIVDDLFATGGTAKCAYDLLTHPDIQCHPVKIVCLIQLSGLFKYYDGPIGSIDCPVLTVFGFGKNQSQPVITTINRLQHTHQYTDEEKRDSQKTIVFCDPSMESIARQIIDSVDPKTGEQKYRYGSINWEHFPDEYPNIRFEHMDYLDNRRVVFIASLYDKARFMELISMIMVLPRQFIKSLDIILPYFAPATMERVDEEGVLATAETVAKMISTCMPQLARGGLPVIHIFDLHALPVRFYFTDDVCIKMESAIPLLKKTLIKRCVWSEVTEDELYIPHITHNVICFPDDGAYKRFKPMFANYKMIVCSKVRESDTRKIKITDVHNIDFESMYELKKNGYITIVDDLVQTGGTLNECRKALAESGWKHISCYVTHAVFPNQSYMKFIERDRNETFEKFYITDTIPEMANRLKDRAPFEVISIADYIVDHFNQSDS